MSRFSPDSLPFRLEVSLPDANATLELGQRLAAVLHSGDLVALSGTLGAGKTTFSQGLAQGLGVNEAVSSPTFVFMNEYATMRGALLHLDAYRMEGFGWDALRDAGFEEFLERREAFRLVEWPEMVAQWLPQTAFWLRFEIENAAEQATRRVTIHAAREWNLGSTQ